MGFTKRYLYTSIPVTMTIVAMKPRLRVTVDRLLHDHRALLVHHHRRALFVDYNRTLLVGRHRLVHRLLLVHRTLLVHDLRFVHHLRLIYHARLRCDDDRRARRVVGVLRDDPTHHGADYDTGDKVAGSVICLRGRDTGRTERGNRRGSDYDVFDSGHGVSSFVVWGLRPGAAFCEMLFALRMTSLTHPADEEAVSRL